MDATLRTRLCARLVDEIETLPPRLQAAAKYVVDNGNDFGLDPIRVSARKIGVSPNTLVRLARHLGFDSFDGLRAPFRTALVERHDSDSGVTWLRRMAGAGPMGAAQAKVAQNELDIVGRSLQLLRPELAAAVTDELTGARNVYVTATRASYTLAYYFHYVARMALPNLHLIPRNMGSPLDEMISVGPGDVLMAMTFPPYSAETIKALRLARARKARVILLSDSELVAPDIRPDLFVQVSTHSTHHFGCLSGAMAVLDCLLAHLVQAGGDEARARIATYESLREDYGAYWQPKLPRVRR
ncbi:MurR/RpiR family transcriptional regulator [Rhodovulum adriaticum]|uniref:RpiR family transcriptional regulator n=1 Tax=Rhodovulum adriaticum TaxID=35804 RepID=A0A4R2NI13_RHOAD|nr:MurR/RpiR family transcriptional regulator [Rhodovulum adriaticum]MBK1635387.1 iron dicitrate transport regulator FecR [Rhodovulum adriaticum]TCP21093.1 RpiR family transcriptional regulator [Rhodovulum adriaticum]